MEKSPLLIKQMEIGPMANYVYFIADEISRNAYVVDAAWDVDHIISEAQNLNLNLIGALVTHGHPDHTNGLNALLDKYDIPVYVSASEASFYKPLVNNIKEVAPSDRLELGNIKIDMLHTPGHTPGSQCFYIDAPEATYHGSADEEFRSRHLLISGDTLFLDGCGRCDLPGGDAETMFDSIANILMQLPDSTVIFPGHNYHHLHCDCLANQKQTNPYLQFDNLQRFIEKRLPKK